MEKNSKVCVGYEVGKEYCQICLYSPEMGLEPVSIATVLGGDRIRIPFLLAKKAKIEQWYYGEEAEKQVEQQEALLVEGFYEKAINQEKILLDGKEYQAELLFQMYIKKSLSLLIAHIPLENISHCTFCMEELGRREVALWKRTCEALPVLKGKSSLISYSEGFAYYSAFQEEKVWERGVLLLEYDGEILRGKSLQISKRTIPYLIQVTEQESCVLEPADNKFFEVAKGLLGTIRAGTVYLVGEGFQEMWYTETLKLLCQGRRVFKGQNLYGLGAVQYAKMKVEEKGQHCLYLGEQQIKVNFFLKAVDRGQEVDYEILSGELHWYEGEKYLEVIADREKEIVVYARGLDGKLEEEIKVPLVDFPLREDKATRLGVKIYFEDTDIGIVEVKDLGFGEIYPSTGKVWVEGFDLQQMQERLNGSLTKV